MATQCSTDSRRSTLSSAGSSISPLVQRDLAHVWHPYTQAKIAPLPIPIVGGKGAQLYAEDGKSYIDAVASWWITLHGHCNPYIADKIATQMKTLEHVMFSDFTHAPAANLAEMLLKILPSNLKRIFYSDNGSTSVETALKMTMQYWHNTGRPRTKVVSFKNGYHGDTLGAMSVSDRGFFIQPFVPFLFDTIAIDAPVKGKEQISLQQLEQALQGDEVACFIFEPLIQGVAGMLLHEAAGLDSLLRLCRERKVFTIADEVMTGFGRTGTLFAVDQLSEKPDIICLAKGITNGFGALGVTACSEAIYEGFLSDSRYKAFLHGHTLCGNPMACVAALATLEVLLTPECDLRRAFIEANHRAFASQIKDHPRVGNCRTIGPILAFDYLAEEGNSYYNSIRDRLARFYLSRGVVLRPFGNMVHVIPPYEITKAELHQVYAAITESLENLP